MPTFQSKPLGNGRAKPGAGGAFARIMPKVRQYPFLLFGAPFILTIVGGSYGLSTLTQSRYDYNATKVQSVSKEQELGMRKDRRRIDIREEYFRLQAKDSELDDWEPKRIARPEGLPEWGVAPESDALAPDTRQERTQEDNESIGRKKPSILRQIYADETPAGSSDLTKGAGRKSDSSARGKVILGPDGKPCRACNSKLAFSAAMKGGAKAGSKGAPSGDAKSAGFGAVAGALVGSSPASNTPPTKEEGVPKECPPDGELLGHSTWIFLHSAAAYYPSEPDTTQQSAMLNVIRALPKVYPCHSCADSLGEELEREKQQGKSWEGGSPLEQAVRSGPGLRKWLCGLHNEVNARLGKPTWPCEEQVLRQRWLDGPDDGSCDA